MYYVIITWLWYYNRVYKKSGLVFLPVLQWFCRGRLWEGLLKCHTDYCMFCNSSLWNMCCGWGSFKQRSDASEVLRGFLQVLSLLEFAPGGSDVTCSITPVPYGVDEICSQCQNGNGEIVRLPHTVLLKRYLLHLLATLAKFTACRIQDQNLSVF